MSDCPKAADHKHRYAVVKHTIVGFENGKGKTQTTMRCTQCGENQIQVGLMKLGRT